MAILRHLQAPQVNLFLNANVAEAPNIPMDVSEKPAGYRIVESPVKVLGGHQAIFVRDPNGNVAELNQPLP